MSEPAWPSAVTLEREGVRLEPLTWAHESGLASAAADGELWRLRFTSVPEPHETRAYIERALTERQQGSRLAFAVIDTASGEVIGSTSYHDILPAIRRVEIGWTWYARRHQRTRVNTLCKWLLLSYAFEDLECAVVGFRVSHMNFASQRAVERLGARRDGVLRHHAPIRDGRVRDTVMYSIVASEWPEVAARLEGLLAVPPVPRPGADAVRLVEVTRGNLNAVLKLDPGAMGARQVASNAASIAQAAYTPTAWYRAIAAGGRIVGFVLLYDPSLAPDFASSDGEPRDTLYLWRFMVDFAHQGRGYGKAALQAVLAHAAARPGIRRIAVSYVPGETEPRAFYERAGFRLTGRIEDDEVEMVLDLTDHRSGS